MSDQPLYSNRLIHQKSPYLLQHAHNPVDWYPWGEEAFEAAKREDRPIFLSIGYATCHWCHVMERESFENVEIAQLLNQTFINIKVDREELPDVDGLYMEFAQSMMSGAAGWPLNVILTPDLEPFFATTYLPPHSSHAFMGLDDLTRRIAELWSTEEKQKIIDQAEKIVEVFASNVHSKGDLLPSIDLVTIAADLLYKMADPVYGGIKGAPKFPIGYQYSFLLRYYKRFKDTRSLFLVERTLEMMHRGGIYDHLGGGFSRYSVDEKWLVPHFEKMLYDNAILAQAYLEGWQVMKRPLYRQVCEEILNYILRDMTHPEGGFYSAEDADSEGFEGLFYTWTYEEILQALGSEGQLFCRFYGVTSSGNFEGRNILHLSSSLKEFADQHHCSEEELQQQFQRNRETLWKIREKRVHPLKDRKILSSWNGLMIFSLAEAGKAFFNESYLQAAIRAARFIKTHFWKEGILLRRWCDGEGKFKGGLDEYAFMIRACLSLFEANGGSEWLQWAIEMADDLKVSYKEESGAFYQTDGIDETLILRRCHFSDGAEPSGNAIHTENLLKLFHLTGDRGYLEQAEDVLKAVKEYLQNYPPSYCYHVMNISYYYNKRAPVFIIALNSKRDHEQLLKERFYEKFILDKSIIWQTQDVDLEELLPFIKEKEAIEDQSTVYLCYEGVCEKPLYHLSDILEVLDKLN